MRISNVEVIILKLPCVGSDVDGTQDDAVVRIDTDEGITGWGEIDSSPYVAKAVVDAQQSHGISSGLRHILNGLDPLLTEQAYNTMYRQTRYHGRSGAVLHAMSGVDLALWDIAGKARGEPIHRLLGANYRSRVKAYASTLMPETPDEACDLAKQLTRRGFLAMKFGWGPIGRSFELDRDLFQAVRTGAGPGIEIMFDAGQCYSWRQAARISELLCDLQACWLEEPLSPDDLQGYKRLAECHATPIAAGEAEDSARSMLRLMDESHIDIVQPDLSRSGGFTEGRRIGFLAAQRGIRCLPHAFKSNILLAASLHFCAANESSDRLEFSVSNSPIRHSLTNNDFPLTEGYVDVPTLPGLGIEINHEVLERLRM